MAPRHRLRRLLGRALAAAAALWLVATLCFLSLRLAPGDPTRSGDPAIPASEKARLAHLYGLDRPLAAQYAGWLRGLIAGDLGWSFRYRRPVARVLGDALPATLLLTGLALALQYGAALTLALAGARHHRLRAGLGMATMVLHALPSFWLGLLALGSLGHAWGWFPTFGAGGGDGPGSWLDSLHHALLPAAVLALTDLAPTYHLTAEGLRRALASPPVLAARARGLGPRRRLWRHALPLAAAPAIHRLGLDLPALLSGSLVLEVLFSRPGLGRVAHQAFLARDLPLLAAGATAAGTLVVVGSLLADGAHALVDPRVTDG